jgi:DNA polymerase (family 10)
VVPDDAYGAALQYFTGSKDHNIRLREIAKSKGMKISEYGIYRLEGEKTDRKIGGRKEEQIYAALGLDWIPPEMREDRGEIELAARGELPPLVDEAAIRGDLHVHSNWSDGRATLEEIATAARKLGYRYVAVCDHSRSLRFAGGLSRDRLRRQAEEIEKLNEKLTGFVLLTGTEVEIASDGSLDFPDQVLETLDVVVASIHSGFQQPVRKIMRRLRSALENPHVDILAHPTGRLISSRAPYSVDLEELFRLAKETRTALEINAYADRLDLCDLHARQAAQAGVQLSIGSDAHHPDQLWMIRLGVGVARRAWLSSLDILNTRSLQGLRRFLRRS